MLARRPHIETVSDVEPAAAWRPSDLAAAAGDDHRHRQSRAGDRPASSGRDGNVVDCATMPLPDGATLVTFQDVTDTVNVERALRERNEALEAADKLKIDFVHHVSYELRSPLTNIIGFAHFLGDPVTGPLTEKQREYLELHHGLHQCAARHHQQHPRPRHHRCRGDDAQSRLGRYPQDHGSGRRRRAGPPGQERDQARNPRRAGYRQLHRRRAARAPIAVQSAGQCRGLFARRRDRYLCARNGSRMPWYSR